MNRTAALVVLALAAGAALAKLPPPSDEAKAKAAEAAAKTAHGNKVADYQLCKSMNATAAFYFASAKKAGKETKPATATPDCADPGAFVYPPPTAGAAPAAAPAAAKPAAPTAAAPAKKT
jgi:type II secretory pathway pseudopilin PulG